MQNKKGLIAIILVLVIILAVAGVAYAALGGSNTGNIPSLTGVSSSEAEGAGSGEEANAANVGEDAGSASGASDEETSSGPVKLTDFSVSTLDGSTTSLSSVYGKPAIVGFWATWCPPCNAEAPTIQKLYEAYGDKVNFMMIDSASDGRDNVNVVKTWLADGNYNYPVYIDETGEAAMAAEIYYLPTMFVLDKDGNVLTAFSGALDEESGINLLEQLISL